MALGVDPRDISMREKKKKSIEFGHTPNAVPAEEELCHISQEGPQSVCCWVWVWFCL